MAPTTRRQQKQRQSMEDESAAATEANGARIDKAAGKAKQNGHKRFDSKDEDEEETIAVSGGVALGEGKEARNDDSEEEGREDDSDDDAPEAVTMGSGRVAAKKREEDAKKAIELQEKAARQKRKQREALFKEQKESAAKRRKVAPKATAESVSNSATEEKDDIEAEVSNDDDYETPAEQLTVTPMNTAPGLLPTALLEKVADLPSSPPQTHKRTGDGSDEDDFRDGMDIDGLEDDGMMLGGGLSFGKAERNRRKRVARKANMEFKKGPVSVKVLKDDKKARKIMMPPANKRVVNAKSTWLSGRGAVKRRSIGSVGGPPTK